MAVSEMIQNMFARPSGGSTRKYYDEFSDGSDMEAGLDEVEGEERMALRIARREDLEEERAEEARKAAKDRARLERDRLARI